MSISMNRYHINGKGEPGLCKARKTECPFGDKNEDHYSSVEEARRAFEDMMQEKGWIKTGAVDRANQPKQRPPQKSFAERSKEDRVKMEEARAQHAASVEAWNKLSPEEQHERENAHRRGNKKTDDTATQVAANTFFWGI